MWDLIVLLSLLIVLLYDSWLGNSKDPKFSKTSNFQGLSSPPPPTPTALIGGNIDRCIISYNSQVLCKYVVANIAFCH